MHDSSYQEARRFVDAFLDREKALHIADVGSYDVNGTLRPLFNGSAWRYHGLDVAAGPNVDRVLSSPYNWPEIQTGEFDVVVSAQALEHIPRPWLWVPEISRICAPGGLVYICAPNTWDYHEYPIDCWRIWPDGMRALFEDAGLETVEAYFHGPDTVGIARKPRAGTVAGRQR